MLWFLVYLSLQDGNLTVPHTYLTCPTWISAFPATASISLPLFFMKVWHFNQLESCISISECHLDCCSCLHSHLVYYFFYTLNLSLSICMLCTCSMVVYVCLYLLTWDFLLLTPCNVIGLLYNNKEAIYFYATLLTAYIKSAFVWICSKLAKLHMTTV